MDVEKTMQFILEQQAGQTAAIVQYEAWLAEHQRAMREFEERSRRYVGRADRQDKQISAMRKLIHAGWQIAGDIGQKQEQLASEMLELRALHQVTETKFQHLVELLTRRNANVH